MNLINFTIEDAYSFTEPRKPYHWKKYNLTVLRDGYLTCGTRIHVVKEEGYKLPCVLGNAVVISNEEGLEFK